MRPAALRGVADAMLAHLNGIESYLARFKEEDAPVDLKNILADA
jgi:hypothetical protein